MTDQTPAAETHWGADPGHGGLTLHKGSRENCTGPDCAAETAEPAGIDPDQLALYRKILSAPINHAHAPLYSIAAHLLAAYDAVAAERDRLRRQLDAAEAAPCEHDSPAFDALERLHARIHRDFNFDASESAAPDDERWARVMDDLVTYANELYAPLADAPREPEKYPAHTIAVTRLPAGFDHNDRREHEYVIGNDITGWTSHQVTHPDACHQLPYGRPCWLDDNWYDGPYRYDEIEPGLYEATWVSEMVGDHNGEFSHIDEYVHYERTGDAPETAPEPEPAGGYSTQPPF